MFIPIAHEELAAIDGTVQLTDRKAHRVTPELLSSLGYTPGQQEDAEYAALVLASVAALAAYGESWFSEAPGFDLSAAAAAAQGLDVDTAWGFEEVQGLLHESDLLWNDVEEYRRGLR